MEKNNWISTILGTAILVALIVLIVNLKNNRPQAAVLSQSSGAQDSMASMHGGGPADSSVFNSLVGQTAPDFTLPSYSGDSVTLSKLRGKNVILFFNEGLMCYPACWNQVAAFAKDTDIKDKGIVVLSITVDPKDQWQQAVAKMPDLAGATVLLDTNKTVSNLYGVLTLPSSMHRGQYPGHSFVLIDKTGVVRFVNDDPDMAIRDKELLNEISHI